MATHQQPTTPVITDMSWMEHTLGNASMMVLGMERLQNAVKQREVQNNDFGCTAKHKFDSTI